MKTELLYQKDTYLLRHTAIIVSVIRGDEDPNNIKLVFDQTIFHPQGGGQPSDSGLVTYEAGLFDVLSVQIDMDTGIVTHRGQVKEGDVPKVGETVMLQVDEKKRMLHARLHTAGHLLSHVIDALNVPLKSIKGYHFPAGPYVEYLPKEDAFDMSRENLERLGREIEQVANQFITESRTVSVIEAHPSQFSADEMGEFSEKAQKSTAVRFVAIGGTDCPRPCGGTHVASLKEIGRFKVKKISTKGAIRISYLVE